ncbi:GNAT family N-acetyltransferase [Massilia sp. H6]|uniref:GNAT family N-acetyltransferase n=1 Tax=Massilia sp. H6 TaxID=2970464 RepID=UPI00216A3110|nr:GNAT family N-acetyltransferase [Massilia sp. H6]UVW28885.1 GNAT family N-acetyltransferase [Massilia sp. H6]
MNWSFVSARSFAEHLSEWARLHASGAASPLLAADFVLPLLAHFARGDELLATCRCGQHVVAMAVLSSEGRARWQTFQPAQAPIGIWLQCPGTDTAMLAAALVRALPGLNLVTAITQCDPELVPRPADGGCVQTLNYIQTARITIEGSFDAYWSTRGKNLRGNLKKQRARLERDGIALRLEVIRDAESVGAAVADYGNLESTGWKAGGGTAVHADNAQGRFYKDMLEAFCRRGAGSIYRYWIGGQLAATDLCIEGADCIVVLKTTYDERVAGSLSPTLLMREEETRELFDQGRFKRIEFYGKVMEWHLRWTDEVRTLYHLNIYRWPALRGWHRKLQARAARQSTCNGLTEQECT